MQLQQQALAAAAGAPIPTLTDGIVNVIQSSANSQQQQQQQQQLVDTSQPPPIRPPTSAALLPPPNTQLQMMPPAFTMPGVPRKFIMFIIAPFPAHKSFIYFFKLYALIIEYF